MDGYVTIGLDIDSKNFDMEIAVTEQKLEGLVEEYKTLKRAKPYEGQIEDLQKLQVEIEQTKNKLVGLKEKQENLGKTSLSQMPATINNIGNGMEGLIKKVIRWGLAIFSIRSIYSLIRQSVSTLSQYNEKLGADIEYMRFALANALAPVIEKIINLAYKLMVYVGYIIKQLFGVNIFANASAKAFERSKNALGGSAKKAKELQKTLTGIDEMNIIQDTGDTSYGGGGGGVALPTQDLKDLLEDFEPPKWLEKLVDKLKILKQWLEDNWDWLSKVLEVAGILFGTAKISGWVSNIGKLIGSNTTGLSGLATTLGLVAAAAVVVPPAVEGIKKAAEAHKELDKAVENQAKTGSMFKRTQDKIRNAIMKTTPEQKELNIAWSNSTNLIDMSRKEINSLTSAINKQSDAEAILDNFINDTNDLYHQNSRAIISNTENINDNIWTLKIMKTQGHMTEQQERIFTDSLKEMIPELEKQKNSLVKGSDAYNALEDTISYAKTTLKEFEDGTVNAKVGLGELYTKVREKVIAKLGTEFNETNEEVKKTNNSIIDIARQKINDKRFSINVDANTTGAESSMGGFVSRLKSNIQNAFDNIKLNKLANGLVNMLSKLAPSVPSSKIRSVFGLASGGIINMPGRGVPLTNNVIGGEAGREGIIPLTDAQAMSTLGEAIGKYITINASITNTMNGRVISRELQKINTENDFAYNR